MVYGRAVSDSLCDRNPNPQPLPHREVKRIVLPSYGTASSCSPSKRGGGDSCL